MKNFSIVRFHFIFFFFFFFWKNFIFNDGLYYILDFLTLLLHTFAIFSRVLFSQNNEHSFLRSIYARLMTNRYYSLVVDFTTNKTENRYFLLFSRSLYTNLSRLVPRTIICNWKKLEIVPVPFSCWKR